MTPPKPLGAALLMSVLLVAPSACMKQEGPAEKAGQSLDNAAESLDEQVENAGEAIQDKANDAGN